MAYDEQLARRVRPFLSRRKGFAEKKMFGGVAYFLHGNVCVGVWKEYLIARIGPHAYVAALRAPFVKEFDIAGRAMRGWVMVAPEGIEGEGELEEWVARAVVFADSLPRK